MGSIRSTPTSPGPPALAEISLDWGTDGKGQALPFAVSRPLLRLGAGQRAKVEVLYQGQGLPFSRDRLSVGPLPLGGAFQPEPGSLAVDVQERQRGWFFLGGGSASLALPASLPIDARLRLADGTLSIEPLPAGRRVLLDRVPRGTQLPVDFVPYGSDSWLRNGQPPLIALDLDATQVIFLAQ